MGTSTWDNAPAGTWRAFHHHMHVADTIADAVDNSWKTDTGSGNDAGGWQADGDTGGDNMDGGFSTDNVSKHADGPHDGGCRK